MSAECDGLRSGAEQVAERLAEALDALDFVLQTRHDRADVRERIPNILHVLLLRRDAVEDELMGLVRYEHPVDQAVDDDAADRDAKVRGEAVT